MELKSEILTALYHAKRDEAEHLADGAAALTVWEAAALNRVNQLRDILAADPTLANAFAADGHTPLGLACFFGAAAAARLLLEADADPHAVSRNAITVQPLHAAVAGRNAEAVTLLLERGAQVNARQQAGYTPLMGAAAGGREDIAELLLANGADRSLTSDDGKTAAAIALEHGHRRLADRLQPAGA